MSAAGMRLFVAGFKIRRSSFPELPDVAQSVDDRSAEDPGGTTRGLERSDRDVEPAAGQQQSAQGVFATEYKSHSGPLPDHDWFAGIEAIHPGATDIILRDFAEERVHQRRMQEQAIALDARVFSEFSRYQRSRLWIAGGLALFLAAGGLALIFFDKAIYGFVLLVSEIAALVAAFLVQRVATEDDLQDDELDQILAELEGGDD